MSADQRSTARAAHEHVPVPVCCRSPPRRPGTAGWRDILALSEDADAIIERVGTCLEYRDPEGRRFPPARVPRCLSISKSYTSAEAVACPLRASDQW
jgi:hypothetical protein